MGCLSQNCTSAIPCHKPSLAVPLLYPGAFSSSSSSSFSIIPALCGNKLELHTIDSLWWQNVLCTAQFEVPQSCGACVGRAGSELEISIACLPTVPCQLQLGPGKVYGGSWNNGLLSLKSNRGRSRHIIMKDSPGNGTSDFTKLHFLRFEQGAISQWLMGFHWQAKAQQRGCTAT